MMTLLILAAIGVSFLVIKDVGTVRTIVSGVQSEYAAEGVTELGLHAVAENLPGYEPAFEDYTFANAALASLDMGARGSSMPCVGDDEWMTLEENESLQIALFAQTDETGAVEDIDDWYVEFYVGDEDGAVTDPPQKDVLRWKILGVSGESTEAVSEYISLNGAGTTSFGPGITDAVTSDYAYAKYYYEAGGKYIYNERYAISSFLAGHEYNYLVLTNVVQESGDDIIYFKLVSDEGVVCEYVSLAAVGAMDFGSTEQSLETLVREGENLPVFDFVLYHTDNDAATVAEEAAKESTGWPFEAVRGVSIGDFDLSSYFNK